MVMARDLKRIDFFCQEYKTDCTIRIDESESGRPQLVAEYERGGHEDRKHFIVGLPADWTDQDTCDLLLLKSSAWTKRGWPAWEIRARDHGEIDLSRFWKGEQSK